MRLSSEAKTPEREGLFTLPVGASYYFPHSQYDISRDDQRFIMFRTAGGGESANMSELIVVENFFEELKAKVGN